MNKETRLRTCWCDGKRALFHGWFYRAEVVAPSMLQGGCPGGQLVDVFALVEFQNGEVRSVFPEDIRFADGGNGWFEGAYFPDTKPQEIEGRIEHGEVQSND